MVPGLSSELPYNIHFNPRFCYWRRKKYVPKEEEKAWEPWNYECNNEQIENNYIWNMLRNVIYMQLL